MTGDLGAAFPIMGINGLHESMKASEGFWLVVMNHIILETFHHCRLADRVLLELDEILSSLMILVHSKLFEFSF